MIDVVVAVITAKGEIKMNDVPENAANTEASAPSVEPTPAKKPRVAAHARHVAPSKGKSAKQAARAKKANKAAKSAKSPKKAANSRQGQQNRQVPGPAEALRRRHRRGSHESHRLAGSLGPRIYLRRAGQEDGPESHVHQGRGRGAPLFAEELKANRIGFFRRRGHCLGGFSLSASLRA